MTENDDFLVAKSADFQLAIDTEIPGLSFEERPGMLVDWEADLHENRKLAHRLKEAKLKQQACVFSRWPTAGGSGNITT